MNLLNILKQGKENALSLEYLSSASGISKRKVRDEINRINTSGEEIICCEGIGKGYFIAANIDEANAYRAYNRSYWRSGIEKDKGIARCIERRFPGQMEIELNER